MTRYGLTHTAIIVASAAFATAAQVVAANAQCPPGVRISDLSAPTDTARTFIRKGAGEFGAGRSRGPHTGVDILTRACYPDADAYAVRAMADGVVAYAKFNGETLDDGFGNVIAIDHGNGCYTMFAHLASDPFTPLPKNPSAALIPGWKLHRR